MWISFSKLLRYVQGQIFDQHYQNELKQENQSYKDASWHKLNLKQVKVLKVQDGDTFTGGFMIDNKFEKIRMRLAGLDTPEIKTTDPNENKAALIIRDKVHEKIFHKIVYVMVEGIDKYGRPLVQIRLKNERKTINEWLIEKKQAVCQNGGTKSKIKNWMEQISK